MSSGTEMHQEWSMRLYSCHAPGEPMGSTRRPSALVGTPGPMRSMMPTPSKPGTRGNAVRDAYAPETVTASEGLKVLTNMRTTTSPARSSPGSGMSRITTVSMGPGVSAITASTHLA